MPLSLYEIRPSSTHGQGMFAKADIPRGSVIIKEPCLASTQLVEENGRMIPYPEYIVRAFEELQPTEQEDFLALHGDDPRGRLFRIVEKWQLNSFHWPGWAWSGVFLKMSRINHSCLPSAVANYDGLYGTITAMRDIAEDEEIFISYVDHGPTLSQQERQQKLKWYEIECFCEACVQHTTTGQLD